MLGQDVIALDNFSTGHRANLEDVRRSVGEGRWNRYRLVEGDIRDSATCLAACSGVDIVLHQAALGSVPRSIADPIATNDTNVTGFLNMLVAAKTANVRRFVYAASSSTYGDHPALPKVEDAIGRPLSPYAVTKRVNELYAGVFGSCYGLETVGLRYFNVFGPRQDPAGAYAAVIPRWIDAILCNQPPLIHGDGETSRDFCYVANVVQANVLAATAAREMVVDEVFNVAVGGRTTLIDLCRGIRNEVARHKPDAIDVQPVHDAPRSGDVRHSQASIAKAQAQLGYRPTHTLSDGLRETVRWFALRHAGSGEKQPSTLAS